MNPAFSTDISRAPPLEVAVGFNSSCRWRCRNVALSDWLLAAPGQTVSRMRRSCHTVNDRNLSDQRSLRSSNTFSYSSSAPQLLSSSPSKLSPGSRHIPPRTFRPVQRQKTAKDDEQLEAERRESSAEWGSKTVRMEQSPQQ